jgi:hypothetical protein
MHIINYTFQNSIPYKQGCNCGRQGGCNCGAQGGCNCGGDFKENYQSPPQNFYYNYHRPFEYKEYAYSDSCTCDENNNVATSACNNLLPKCGGNGNCTCVENTT